MDKNIKNIKFVEIDSSLEGTKEFVVTYDYEGKPVKDFIFVNKKEGLKQSDYLKIAKKEFKPNRKTVKGGLKSSPLALKVVAGCALAAAVTLGGLFTWKALTTSNIGDDTYTVTWNLANGSEPVKETYHEGEIPKYKGKTPVKANETKLNDDGLQYEYEFEGWLEDIKPVTEDVTYTASYEVKSLYAGFDVFVTQAIIEDESILGGYRFIFGDATEEQNLQINWDYGSGTEDDKIVSDTSHTYTTPGLKKIRIYSEIHDQFTMSYDEPDMLPLNYTFKRIVIPYYVTKVGWYWDEDDNLFDYWSTNTFQNLREIILPSNLEEIYHFIDNCWNLNFIKLPRNLRKMHKGALYYVGKCNVKVFSKNIEEIDEGAFEDIQLEDGISFNSIGTIHTGAFSGCTIPNLFIDSVESIEESPFNNSNINNVAADSIGTLGKSFLSYSETLESFIVNHIGSIEGNAFNESYVRNFKVNEIDTIKERAFQNFNVDYFEINHIKNIETYGLIINVAKSFVINIIDNVAEGAFTGIEVRYSTSYLPIVTNPCDKLFANLTADTIVIPDYYSVLTQGFLYNSTINEIIMPKTLTEIESYALYIPSGSSPTLDFRAVNIPPTIYDDSFEDEYGDQQINKNMKFLVNQSSYELYKTQWGTIIPDIVNLIFVG